MAKVKRVLRCYHCGAILQTENPEEPGYITKSVIEGKRQVLIPYCNNCYESMITLNGSVLDQQVDNDILKVLDDAVATDALIVWVIDLFSFNGTLNPDLIKKLRKQKVWVVGTKRDLFPRSIKKEVFDMAQELNISSGRAYHLVRYVRTLGEKKIETFVKQLCKINVDVRSGNGDELTLLELFVLQK